MGCDGDEAAVDWDGSSTTRRRRGSERFEFERKSFEPRGSVRNDLGGTGSGEAIEGGKFSS